MYTIELTDDAVEDMKILKKNEQALILDSLPDQLGHEPLVETRNRKPLRPNDLSGWELRIGQFRVFFDVDPEAEVVLVKAVGRKDHNTLSIRGQEFTL